VRRPPALPVALSANPESGCTGAASAQFSPPNDSASLRPNYVTADRLFRIGCEMGELDWTLLSFVSAVRLATGKQLGRRFWNAGGRLCRGQSSTPGTRTPGPVASL
jgi:hypothetical protein